MRVESLGFFRFIAALIIVIYHYRYASAAQSIEFVHWPIFNGVQMVTFFFVLSGYVNYLAYGGKPNSKNAFNLKRFIVSRVARVLPLYYFALIIALLAFSAVGKTPTSTVLWLHITSMQAWIPEYAQTLNFVTWTISVDVFLYALFPIILYWMHKQGTSFKQMLCINGLLYAVTQVVLSTYLSQPDYPGEPSVAHNFTHNYPLFHLSSFMLGMLAGYYVTHHAKYLEVMAGNGFNVICFSILMVFIVLGKDINLAIGWTIETPSSYAPLFAFMLIAMSVNKSWLMRALEHRFFVYLGSLSYAIYILQILVWFIYQALIQPQLPQLSATEHLLLGVMMLLLVSALTHKLVEAPANNWIRAKLR